ncbi:sensor histidine kinase [Streptomyces chartreusis]|uniref:histidine kinase n=1 Tax=Streptomyces chartreusis TaxID=1969 RepID=A0A7H8TKK7_STRCX|nr:ATP-binding protein [Streptomyces chartreusis]QKZ23884.1 ATP-binding protein [Streptomyces chartreusis]
MPSPQRATRPANHRRRRGRSRIDRYLLNEVAGVLYVPLAWSTVLAGLTVLATWAFHFTTAQLALCLAGSLIVTAAVGGIRTRAMAASLQRAREADLRRIADAIEATEKSMVWTAEELCRGVRPPLPAEPRWDGDDALALVLQQIGNLQVQGAGGMLRVHDESQAAVLVTMHQTLTRRQHALIGDMLEHLTQLQKATEDAELLDWSFKIDHLATRLRRMVESVSVALGGKSLRETRTPMPVTTVLRGAKSEVVKYSRVRTAPGDVGVAYALPAHVHPDVTHLLAELIDNGLDNSDPASNVTVRVDRVAHGLAFEVEDRALILMDPAERDRLNALLKAPSHADVADQVRKGHLGLVTAAKIAERHGLRVFLQMNPAGGTTANVVVPKQHLVAIAPVIGTVPVPAEPRHAQELAPTGAGQPPPSTHTAPAPQSMDAGSQPLPKRQREQRPMPAQTTATTPPPAVNPRTVADWRTGLHAGLQADTPPTQP